MSLTRRIEEIAEAESKTIATFVGKNAREPALVARELDELRLNLVKLALELSPGSVADDVKDSPDLVLELGHAIPSLDVSGLRRTRTSAVSLAAAVVAGWLIGGLLSGLLNFFSLGGDILRAAAIFGALWLSEYFSANAKARKFVLAAFGLGGLAKFASALTSGALRAAGFGGLRQAIFGGKSVGFFKGAWLLLGASFLLVFFSKKIEVEDPGALEENLRAQIEERLRLALFMIGEIGGRDAEIKKLKDKVENAGDQNSRRASRVLVEATLSLADNLEGEKRDYLREKMREAGITPADDREDGDFLVWDAETHAPLYDAAGLVKNGDRCRILRRPGVENEKIIKGFVQKMAPKAASGKS